MKRILRKTSRFHYVSLGRINGMTPPSRHPFPTQEAAMLFAQNTYREHGCSVRVVNPYGRTIFRREAKWH